MSLERASGCQGEDGDEEEEGNTPQPFPGTPQAEGHEPPHLVLWVMRERMQSICRDLPGLDTLKLGIGRSLCAPNRSQGPSASAAAFTASG